MAGLYIHIPFCASRCIYCDFYSTTSLEELQDVYIDSLLHELTLRLDYLHGEPIHTIYIGGGTPSQLSCYSLEKLISELYRLYPLIEPTEFTIECNPDDISPTLVQTMRSLGVNRVSMGVQTFSDERLRFLRRRHVSDDINKAIETLRAGDINNISIDLMFGFPSETISEWSTDLDRAISLNVEHISAYSLMYEEGTPLYKMLKSGKVTEINEEVSRSMYNLLIDKLAAADYIHYEISNFSKYGYASKHNSNYWNGTHYIGLGAGAHSYDGNSRQWNVCNIREYIKGNGIPENKEQLDEMTKYNDLVTTSLRTRDGICLSSLSETQRAYILRNAQKALSNALIINESDHLHLTREGLFVSDDVMSDLIWVE